MHPLDQLMFLFLHLHKHLVKRNCKLISFYDIILVLEKDNIAFKDLLEYAESKSCANEVSDILEILKVYFGFQMKDDYRDSSMWKDSDIPIYFYDVLSHSRASLSNEFRIAGQHSALLFKSASFPRKIQLFLALIIPDRKYLKSNYPKKNGSIFRSYRAYIHDVVLKFKKFV